MDEINGSQLVLMLFFFSKVGLDCNARCLCVCPSAERSNINPHTVHDMHNSHFNRLELFMLFGMD